MEQVEEEKRKNEEKQKTAAKETDQWDDKQSKVRRNKPITDSTRLAMPR